MDKQQLPPNHHADYPGFAGAAGLVAALSMAFGRKGDARLVVRLSGMGSGDVVVDVGCGPGVAVRYAARLGATVIGVDPAPVMLRVARLLSRRSAKVRYIKGIAEEIPLPEKFCFGRVVDRHRSPLVRRRCRGFEKCDECFVRDGCLVAMERSTHRGARGHASHGWTDEQATLFADRCREHGFTEVRVEPATCGRRSTVSAIAKAP